MQLLRLISKSQIVIDNVDGVYTAANQRLGILFSADTMQG